MSIALRSAFLAAFAVLATRVDAQTPDPFTGVPSFLPTCAEQGVARFAISVPPDRAREDIVAALSRGEILPGGSEAFIFPEGGGPRLLNGEELGTEARRTLGRILGSGLKVDGKVSVLLTIDTDGNVKSTIPSSGNRDLDRLLDALWRKAEFAPVVVGGCRVDVFFHMPLAFVSDFSLGRNGMRMQVGPLRPESP
jgi:hypothetical protein